MDDPEPVNKCSGCEHFPFADKVGNKPVRGIKYIMDGFMEQCVERYL